MPELLGSVRQAIAAAFCEATSKLALAPGACSPQLDLAAFSIPYSRFTAPCTLLPAHCTARCKRFPDCH